MLPADFFTLQTLGMAALWGGAAAGVVLLGHAWRDRDHLRWLWRNRHGLQPEPYPEPAGYHFDIVTPQERAAVPRFAKQAGVFGATAYLALQFDAVIAGVAIPALLALSALAAIIVSDDASEVGSPDEPPPGRWTRAKPHLVDMGLAALLLYAFAHDDLIGGIIDGGLDRLPSWTGWGLMGAVFACALSNFVWRYRRGAPEDLDEEQLKAWEDRTAAALMLAILVALIGLIVLLLD